MGRADLHHRPLRRERPHGTAERQRALGRRPQRPEQCEHHAERLGRERMGRSVERLLVFAVEPAVAVEFLLLRHVGRPLLELELELGAFLELGPIMELGSLLGVGAVVGMGWPGMGWLRQTSLHLFRSLCT